MGYTQFALSLCMEDTLQDALKVQSSLLPWRKAAERLCIMTVHVILPLDCFLYTPYYHSPCSVHSSRHPVRYM